MDKVDNRGKSPAAREHLRKLNEAAKAAAAARRADPAWQAEKKRKQREADMARTPKHIYTEPPYPPPTGLPTTFSLPIGIELHDLDFTQIPMTMTPVERMNLALKEYREKCADKPNPEVERVVAERKYLHSVPENNPDVPPDILEKMYVWRTNPLVFVRDNFGAQPDLWQEQVLMLLTSQPRVAMSACKGPGKSCLLAWCVWWIMVTNQDAQGVCVSITRENLRDGLWKELAVWLAKSPFIQKTFEITSERILSKERPKTWFCSARGFAQDADAAQQANTLAGLHSKVVFAVLDEVGDYPLGVVSAADGIFATEGQKAWLLAAGNPTNVDGALYHITVRDATRWHVVHITGDPDDEKRSSRISKQWAQEQIDQWGRDNPWVMVNVLGLFPPLGSDKLIDPQDVSRAQQRDADPQTYSTDAIVWGLDPAYSLTGDVSALARRQGSVARKFLVWRGLNGPDLAVEVAKIIIEADRNREGPDVIFVDRGGVGASAYDHLNLLGYGERVIGVDFGGSASDRRFADKRAEMWFKMNEWLSKGNACLPRDTEILGELTAPSMKWETRNKRTCMVLQSKKELKAKGIKSPNKADAVALTFAEPVSPKSKRFAEAQDEHGASGTAKTEYDPFAR